jgi:hypothetical protein
VLFPDVIGTGGAPKRVTSRKRKTIGGDEEEPQINLLVDATYGQPAAPPQRPTAAAIPPRTSITTASVLTPPEETPRQRFIAQQPNKRSRTDYLNATVPPPPTTDSIGALADALRSKGARPGWSEQALDIFFRDFGEEDMDLQIKIAEKALAADENKAMVFCKMPVVLRKHWVKRLREVHLGHNRT